MEELFSTDGTIVDIIGNKKLYHVEQMISPLRTNIFY